MRKAQFPILLLCSLITWWVGAGLMPLLPIYAGRLGAAPAQVGLYLAFAFLALAGGSVSAGWLASRYPRRRLLILVSLPTAPALWLMGQVTVLWQLALCTATVWFSGGASLVLISVLVGRLADVQERGRHFGLLALTTALAGVFGAVTGPIADRWGYTALFTIVAAVWLAQVGGAVWLAPEARVVSAAPPTDRSKASPTGGLFFLLLMVNLLVSSGSFIANIGRSLAMDGQGFAATAVTVTAAVGSVAALLFNPLVGALSDRYPRPRLLMLTYLVSGLSLLVLATATTLTGFTLVALLMAMAGAERAVAAALVTDLVPTAALDQAMAIFDGVRWIGGIVGFAGVGYAFQQWGVGPTLWLTLLLPTLAVGLLLLAPWPTRNAALDILPQHLT
jgi:MFS family permease